MLRYQRWTEKNIWEVKRNTEQYDT